MFKKEMLKLHKRINEIENINKEELNDKDYNTLWYEENNIYKWYLIRMEQWLGDINCKASEELYNLNMKAQEIGMETGYYWNKYSKQLFKAVDEGLI